jgi:hypothetical protein
VRFSQPIYTCPDCEKTGEVTVRATTYIKLDSFGKEISSEYDIYPEDGAECCLCGYQDELRSFEAAYQ